MDITLVLLLQVSAHLLIVLSFVSLIGRHISVSCFGPVLLEEGCGADDLISTSICVVWLVVREERGGAEPA
jgi:hypothetical protein